MSSINATNITGLSYTSDSTGALELRTQGTNAVSISSSQIVTVNSSTAATSTSTGALVVTGGIGTGGNIYASGNIFSAGAAVPTFNSMIAFQLAL